MSTVKVARTTFGAWFLSKNKVFFLFNLIFSPFYKKLFFSPLFIKKLFFCLSPWKKNCVCFPMVVFFPGKKLFFPPGKDNNCCFYSWKNKLFFSSWKKNNIFSWKKLFFPPGKKTAFFLLKKTDFSSWKKNCFFLLKKILLEKKTVFLGLLEKTNCFFMPPGKKYSGQVQDLKTYCFNLNFMWFVIMGCEFHWVCVIMGCEFLLVCVIQNFWILDLRRIAKESFESHQWIAVRFLNNACQTSG